MEIKDIEIKIKKYDPEKNRFILNIIFFKKIEIRGWVVALFEKKTTPQDLFWKLIPPSKSIRRNKFFWICRILDNDLWQKVEKEAIRIAKSYQE